MDRDVFSFYRDNPHDAPNDLTYVGAEVNDRLHEESKPWRASFGPADYHDYEYDTDPETGEDDGRRVRFELWGVVFPQDGGESFGLVKWIGKAFLVNKPKTGDWSDALYETYEYGSFIVEAWDGERLFTFDPDGYWGEE